MIIPEKADIWAKTYRELKKEESYDYFMETFNKRLPEHFLEGVDVVDYLLNGFSFLDEQKEHDKILNLIDTIYKHNENTFKKGDKQYIDQYLLDIKLYRSEVEYSDYRKFIDAPVESVDKLIDYLRKTIYYGYKDIAYNISKEVFKPIEEAPDLIVGAERDFAETVYLDKWQSHYDEIKTGAEPDKNEFLKFMENYNYKLDEYYDIIANYLMSEELDSEDFNQEFLKGQREFVTRLKWSFLNYMYEEKDINFQISNSIWQETLSFLLSDKTLEELFRVEGIFIIDRLSLISYLKKMTSFLSDNSEKQFLLLWGMVYIYDFLYKQGIIPELIYRSALKIINWIKPEVVSAHSSKLWKYSFIHRLPKSESVKEDIFKGEKDLFIKTYSCEIKLNDIEDIYPYGINQDETLNDKESINIGRNDPCICGSGRKYKKCCLRLMEKQERKWKRSKGNERNFIWTIGEIAEMTTEEIIDKLFYFGVYFNKDAFKNRLMEDDSVANIVNQWFEKFEIRARYFDRDFIKLAAEVLKNRLNG